MSLLYFSSMEYIAVRAECDSSGSPESYGGMKEATFLLLLALLLFHLATEGPVSLWTWNLMNRILFTENLPGLPLHTLASAGPEITVSPLLPCKQENHVMLSSEASTIPLSVFHFFSSTDSLQSMHLKSPPLHCNQPPALS